MIEMSVDPKDIKPREEERKTPNIYVMKDGQWVRDTNVKQLEDKTELEKTKEEPKVEQKTEEKKTEEKKETKKKDEDDVRNISDPIVILSKKVNEAVQGLVKVAKNDEFLLFFKTKVIEGENNLLVEDYYMPKQDVSGASAKLTDDGVRELSQVEMKEYKGIFHSHNSMTAFHSGTDEKAYALASLSGSPYYLFMTCGKGGSEYIATIVIRNSGLLLRKDVKVQVEEDVKDVAEWKSLWEEKIEKKSPYYNKGVQRHMGWDYEGEGFFPSKNKTTSEAPSEDYVRVVDPSTGHHRWMRADLYRKEFPLDQKGKSSESQEEKKESTGTSTNPNDIKPEEIKSELEIVSEIDPTKSHKIIQLWDGSIWEVTEDGKKERIY